MAQIITRYNILPSEKTAEPVAISKSSIITYAQDGLYIKLERRHGINWKLEKLDVCLALSIFKDFIDLDLVSSKMALQTTNMRHK